MRFSEILAASSLVAAPLVAAHGDVPHAPKIWGLGPNPMQKLKGRNFAGPAARRAALPQHAPQLNKRQGGADGRCGPEGGGASCDEGYCCSSAGWCGNTEEYCMAPDCLFNYGPACDANKVPNGADTRNIARPQLGSVPYGGEGIYQCTVPGTVAITYDDGPYIYTNDVLDQFASYGMKATFFITGNNIGKGAIDDASTPWPAVISRMLSEGHQVASHTWSHQDLSAITQAQRIDQMVHNEMAIRNIIQKFPTYMRPPYSSCTAASGCQSDLADLGYVVSYFNLDTDDYNNVTPDLIQNAKDNFYDAINPSNPSNDDFLAIAHDIHQQTALNLTGYMLGLLQQKGYRGVTMGECMGDPEANWYRDSSGTVVTSTSATPSATQSGSSTLTPPTATPGTSTDHCGTGCNPFYGNCGSSSGGSSTVAPSSTPATSTPTSTPTGLTSSPDGTCGPNTAYTCIGFELGECCSTYGWCGNTADHCGTGCNPLYGNCGSSVSTNGKCGTKNGGMTCKGYKGWYGRSEECCRWDGKCGGDVFSCGMGCQKKFGKCWW
ncbi:carbohydrate esterase family 4 protein [Trematosphaeria pertusa]|uniref:Carbohydrate esterase family 4 protein n=1 Tax=Trematosphaeria pertusa TaxID=390896 RepID=A0A6A6IZX3_9PLEO|nr:carbohydrate esterase family 4 protein [Trematosphaeria pertusa]KAF2255788.1 carbohydrate esterase family 4 protein [Trematosphaeria pertusa]